MSLFSRLLCCLEYCKEVLLFCSWAPFVDCCALLNTLKKCCCASLVDCCAILNTVKKCCCAVDEVGDVWYSGGGWRGCLPPLLLSCTNRKRKSKHCCTQRLHESSAPTFWISHSIISFLSFCFRQLSLQSHLITSFLSFCFRQLSLHFTKLFYLGVHLSIMYAYV